MSNSLLIAGIVCMVAAVVGGGVKLLGAEVPVLNSFPRQALLFVLGLVFLVVSFQVDKPAGPGAVAASSSAPVSSASPSSAPAPVAHSAACPPETALTCLPKSSAPVSFADPAAANQAAARNIKAGLSTSQGQAAAIQQGSSGKAARLCGIIASNDSSPLGKHLAAVRLNKQDPTDGQASDACMAQAAAFL